MDHMMNVLFLAGFSLYRCVQCYPRNRIWQLEASTSHWGMRLCSP